MGYTKCMQKAQRCLEWADNKATELDNLKKAKSWQENGGAMVITLFQNGDNTKFSFDIPRAFAGRVQDLLSAMIADCAETITYMHDKAGEFLALNDDSETESVEVVFD